MTFQVPRQQARYADTGRREIDILGRRVLASCLPLKEADVLSLKCSHEIFVDKLQGVQNQQIVGQTIVFDGKSYRVVRVVDPRISDPVMRGRYLKLLSVAVPD